MNVVVGFSRGFTTPFGAKVVARVTLEPQPVPLVTDLMRGEDTSDKTVWHTSQDGRVLRITAMATEHIINSMAYLWRTQTLAQYQCRSVDTKETQAHIHALGAELKKRMEMKREEHF